MNMIRANLNNLFRYRFLIEQLVGRDLKLKYRRSFLGYLWTILNPLMVMVVMTIVFSTMFKRSIENFPVYLLLGRSFFDFINESCHFGMSSIPSNASLLKKTYVPKYIFTFARCTTSFVNFILAQGALVIVLIATQVMPTKYFLFYPIVLIQIYVFALGLSLFLAQANVFFRDITHIFSAITTAWMYLTPIFYPLESLPESLQWGISNFNPLYYYIQQARMVILYQQMPSGKLIVGGIGFSVLALIVGIVMFRKNQDKFIFYI